MRSRLAARWCSRIGALVVAGVCAIGLLLAGASSASAHDYLVSSNPADGSVVRSQPGTLSLTFNDLVLNSASIANLIQISGPDGRHYELGCPTVLDRTVTVPVGLGPAGSYVVRWRIVSADGHPVTQNIGFRYAPDAAVGKQAGTQASRCADTGDGSAAPATAAAARKAGSSLAAPLAATGVIILLALGAVFVLLRRSRPPRASTAHADDSDDD